MDDERLLSMAVGASDIVYRFRIKPSYAFEYVSPNVTEILGYTPEEHYAEPMLGRRVVHPDDRHVLAAMEDSDGTLDGVVIRWIRPDGEVIWTSHSTRPVHDAAGELVAVEGVARDVTRQKRVELELAESEARFRATFEQAAVGMAHVGLDGKWLRVNRRLCGMLGYERHELAQLTFQELTHPDDLAADLEQAERLFAGEIPHYQMEKRYICKDGRVVWARMTGSLVRRPDGAIDYAVAVVEDINEQKREEASRRHVEDRFRALIETASDVICVLDTEARAQYVSPSVQHVYGYSPADLEGRPVLDLIHRDDAAKVQGTIERVTAAPDTAVHFSVRLRRGDGSWCINDATARNLLSEPAVRGIVITTRDTTSRSLLEEQLREAQKMEAVGRLAGGVAHDFNNLLTAMHGFTSVALARLPADSPVEAYLRKVLDASESATRLTRQLLTFSRRERFVPSILDVRTVVTDAAKMLEPIIGEDVALSLLLDERPCFVLSDQGQMEQVILNLAINARDALETGGEVNISVEPRVLRETVYGSHGTIAAGRYIALVVADNGPGISSDVSPHIFEPFFTTKVRGRGTGLGLATVYGIVVRAGGYVDVESPETGGTIFTILLPESEAQPSSLPTLHPETVPAGQGELVLVAEDDPVVRELICSMLRDLGYQVTEAGDAARALEAVDAGPAMDMLLTDVVMPGMSGFELARRLLVRCPGLPVLYTSGYAGDELAVRGVPTEIDLLEKPFTLARLARAVRLVLERGSEARATGS